MAFWFYFLLKLYLTVIVTVGYLSYRDLVPRAVGLLLLWALFAVIAIACFHLGGVE